MKSFALFLFITILCFLSSNAMAQDTVAVRYMKYGKEVDLSKGYPGGFVSFTLDISPAQDYMIFWQGELVRGKNTVEKISGTGKEVSLTMDMGKAAQSGDRFIFTVKRVTYKKDGKVIVVKANPSMCVIPIF